jgi:hypothetical protein
MSMEEKIQRALESETRGVQMPTDAPRRIRSRASWRRFAGAVGLLASALLLVLVGNIAIVNGQSKATRLAPGSSAALVMPNVVGMNAGDAMKVVIASGVNPSLRYEISNQPVGTVIGTDPRAGADIVGSSVVLTVSGSPPSAGPTQTDLAPLAAITEANHDVFVGAYRDSSGKLHAVFNAGADQEAWRSTLEASVPKGETLVMDECSVSYTSLSDVLQELAARNWAGDASSVNFAAVIDPQSCSVVMTTQDLSPSGQKQLEDRFGALITIDTSGEPAVTISNR